MNFKKIIKKGKMKKKISSNQTEKMLSDLNQQKLKNMGLGSKAITIISTIGGLLLGLGIILFIADNWEILPKLAKLIFAVLFPVLSLIIAYFLIFIKKKYKKTGYAFVLLGSLSIGASIAIICQVYHINSNLIVLIGIWSILSIPLIYIFESRAAAVVSTCLIGIFIFFKIAGSEASFNFLDDDVFFLDTVFYLPHIYIGYGILLALIYEWHDSYLNKVYKKIGNVYKIISIILILFFNFILTIGIYHMIAMEHDNLNLFGASMRLLYIFIFIGILILLYNTGIKKDDKVLLNFSFFWTGIFIITLYIDSFWSTLNIPLLFIGSGILLIYLSIFFKKKIKNNK